MKNSEGGRILHPSMYIYIVPLLLTWLTAGILVADSISQIQDGTSQTGDTIVVEPGGYGFTTARRYACVSDNRFLAGVNYVTSTDSSGVYDAYTGRGEIFPGPTNVVCVESDGTQQGDRRAMNKAENILNNPQGDVQSSTTNY